MEALSRGTQLFNVLEELVPGDSKEVFDALIFLRHFFTETRVRRDVCPDIYEFLKDENRAGWFHVSLASFDQLAAARSSHAESLP